MFLLALFNSFNIRLKFERQTVSSCAELGEQKHYGTTTQSQVVTKKYTVFALEVWLTNCTD